MEWRKFETALGSPLYICKMPGAQSVASAVFVRAGTREEVWPKESGIAHALEHMLFHGAGRFPDSKAVSEAIEKTGGWLNAWTDKEATCYINGVPPEHIETALLVLSEQIFAPRLLADKIPTEMSNIIEEIKMHNDKPMSFSGILFEEAIYKGHALGKNTLGTVEALKNFTQSDFKKFHTTFYHPKNFALVIAGAVNSSNARSFFKKYFDSHKAPVLCLEPALTTNRGATSQKITGLKEKIVEKDIEQANIQLGWLIPGASSKDTIALKLFREMLRGGMSFPLFQEVREKRGLCYAVNASVCRYSDAGDFSIYIGTSPERVKEAVDVALDVVWSTRNRTDLLKIVKNMMLGKIKLSSEATSDVLDRALGDLARGQEPKSFSDTLREIKEVIIAEVESSVERHLAPEKLVKAMVIPRKDHAI